MGISSTLKSYAIYSKHLSHTRYHGEFRIILYVPSSLDL